MELENIIISKAQVQKAKGYIFFLICGIEAQYNYKQYYTYTEINTQHVSKVGLTEESKGGGKEGKKDSEL
jgi:hypothetical protein